ncbi:hypothetical protein [Melissospora conviva]|uniref:hypothetical protein n=1 Tax=Melissospora conviva TaxID=3388432 RepID=UPI003B7A5029
MPQPLHQVSQGRTGLCGQRLAGVPQVVEGQIIKAARKRAAPPGLGLLATSGRHRPDRAANAWVIEGL